MTGTAENFVGFGVYVKGDAPGTLDAQWARSDVVAAAPEEAIICGGRATGGPAEGFAGSYAITYTDEKGKPGAPYQVTIKKAGGAYQLIWERDGKTPYRGVGMELDGKLVFGWGPNDY